MQSLILQQLVQEVKSKALLKRQTNTDFIFITPSVMQTAPNPAMH